MTASTRTSTTASRAGLELDAVHADVSDAASVDTLFAHVADRYGRVDLLVNNAGIAHGPESETHILSTEPEQWDRLIAVNLRSLYLCSRAAAKTMVARRSGVIVNLGSAGATRAHRNRVAYDATKGAIESATRALALDLAPWGIRVNAVAPGAIVVERRSSIGDTDRAASDLIPLGRLGTAADVAGVVRFLASDDAAYLTGIVVTVDGGLSAQLRPPALDARPPIDPEDPA